MSMYDRELGSIPEEAACIARAVCPKGILAMRLRDEPVTISIPIQRYSLSGQEWARFAVYTRDSSTCLSFHPDHCP